ncbi:hypothetical protein UFOVP558_31 [uncultured Caudovirales phage]|uniref:Uncharacterized protein n=1 Tax=uncultured Caudovirales phage TaxID=2100421 RepID=A0A6J5MTP2_9CAUD|nr:hypothetical protein UFOVP558_31 [uncultured Caudovirales phage]
MDPIEFKKWMDESTLEELVKSCIWQSVMEGTAHCGWTDRAREGLVESVNDSVIWALRQKLPK